MNKCDFCKHSYLKNGKLNCIYDICVLNQKEIDKIIKNINKCFNDCGSRIRFGSYIRKADITKQNPRM